MYVGFCECFISQFKKKRLKFSAIHFNIKFTAQNTFLDGETSSCPTSWECSLFLTYKCFGDLLGSVF